MPSAKQFIFLGNEFLPADLARLPVNDLSILRGYGVFEFFRVEERIPVFIGDHLQRLANSASVLGLELPFSPADIQGKVAELIARNSLKEGGVRITLTGGSSPDGFLPGEPVLIINTGPKSTPPPSGGLKLKTFSHRRQLPRAKTIDYLVPIRAWSLLREEGFDDLLYLHEDRVSECSRANLFIVTPGQTLVTTDEFVLEGITRRKVLELAEAIMPVEVRPITLEEVQEAAEVFVTSTTKELTRVRSINEQPFEGPTPITDELGLRFRALRQAAIRAQQGADQAPI